MARLKTCEGCSELFDPGNNPKKRHCNRRCWLRRYNVVGAQHARHGAETSSLLPHGRGSGTKTYVKEHQRHQHRIVAERELGRPLLPGEVVHHEDLNKKNNDPGNLIVFPSQAEHARHHAHLRRNALCHCSCTRFKKQT